MSNVCFWHAVEEEITKKSFLQCPTCKHVFEKESDFRREAFALVSEEYDDNGKVVEGFSKQTWPDDTATKDITWCPFCGGRIND